MSVAWSVPLALSFFMAAQPYDDPVIAPRPEAAGGAIAGGEQQTADPARRRQARSEYVEARRALAETLASALTSEELVREVTEISVRLSLRKAEDRLSDVGARLDELERQGRSAMDEAARLVEREKALAAEVERLRRRETAADGGETATLAAQVAAGKLRTAMAEETEYLADVLPTEELLERARRLRRLALIARIAGDVRAVRREREATGERESRRVVPAGGTDEPNGPDEGSLGEGTSAPPRDPADADSTDGEGTSDSDDQADGP